MNPLPTDIPAAAWQGGSNAAAVTAEGVRCGSCGAHTPVLGSDPVCLFCSMPVALPSDVEERARRVQENLERARREARELDRELASDGMGYVRFILAAQFGVTFLSLAVWTSLLLRAERIPTGQQLLLVACSFFGPLLFWGIAQSLRLDARLREAAGAAFARLEVLPHPTGVKLRLSCPGCGGELDSSEIRGLTIRCKQCHDPLLAPGALVDEGQQQFLQKVLALRRRLERKSYAREIILCVAGLLYFVAVVWVLKVTGSTKDMLTVSLVLTAVFPLFLTFFWALTHNEDGWDFFWMACMLITFPVVPLFGLVMVYLQLTGHAPAWLH